MKHTKYKIFVNLFLTIFTTVTGIGIVVPLLPVYAYDLGASGLDIGLVLGSFSLSRGLLLPFFGRLSDKNGRKPYIITGLFIYTFIPIAFILAKNVKILIITRFIQGIASAMIIPSIQAYVAEIAPKGSEGKAMGLFNMSVFLGLSTGPLLGGFLKDIFGINTALISMSILSLISLLSSTTFLPSSTSKKENNQNKQTTEWKIIFRDKIILSLIFLRLTYTTCMGIVWGFLPLLAHKNYGMSSSTIGILIMSGIGISGLAQIPMGWLSDKINRKIMILTGCFIIIISIFSFTLSNKVWQLIFSNILFGLGGSLLNPTIMAIAIVRGNKNKALGFVMSLLTTGHSFGMLLGSTISGIMMDFFDLKQIFYIGPPIMLIGTITFILCTQKYKF